MSNSQKSRREFLQQASVMLAVPFILNCRTDTSAQDKSLGLLDEIKKNAINDPSSEWWGAKDAPPNVGFKTTLATASDQAPRLRITVTVYQSDGKTPAPNILIYLYHTDAYGIYGRTSEHRHGKYRGWVLTDTAGRYGIDTIMPASYPSSTTAAHIHMTLTGKNLREDWIDSILFEGDRFLTTRDRVIRKGGFRFNPVLKLEKDANGVLAGVRDIRL